MISPMCRWAGQTELPLRDERQGQQTDPLTTGVPWIFPVLSVGVMMTRIHFA